MWIIAEVEPHGEREAIRYLASSKVENQDGNLILVPSWTDDPDQAARYLDENQADHVAFSILIDRRTRGQSFHYELEAI